MTLDIGLQRAAERALRLGIETARAYKSYHANGGAIVALDPRDGAILAMASNPTYKPSVYVGRVDPQKIEPLVNDEAAKAANYPGLNRATQVSIRPARRSSRSSRSPRCRSTGWRRTSRSSARRTPSTGSTSRSSSTGTRT